MPPFDWSSLLGWSAVITIAAAAGNILADFAKSYFLGIAVARWQQRQELTKVFDKYKNPLTLAGSELANRLTEICKLYPTTFLLGRNLKSKQNVVRSNSDGDEYYKKYKLVSTLYRFCAFLGWLELYRRDTVLLSSGDTRKDKKVGECVKRFRSAISDGHLNSFNDWKTWKDHLIFREELRAVGESMVRLAAPNYQVMGYADFEKLWSPRARTENRWASVALDFFTDPIAVGDFRRIRYCLMLISLCDPIESLSDHELDQWLSDGRARAHKTLVDLNYRLPAND